MSLHDDFQRLQQQHLDMLERVRRLERLNPLEDTSIDRGPGIAVKVPAGVEFKEGGSAKAGTAEFSSADGGKVGAGGTKIGADGVIKNDDNNLKIGSNTEFAGNATAKGALRGEMGVLAPYKTMGMQQLAPLIASAHDKADTADTKAGNAAAAAAAAQSTANGRATTASVAAVQSDLNNVKSGSTPIAPHLGLGTKITGIGEAGGTGGNIRLLGWNMASGTLVYMSAG